MPILRVAKRGFLAQFAVLHAHDRREALEVLRGSVTEPTAQVDLVLADACSPDGLALLRDVAALGRMPVIGTSTLPLRTLAPCGGGQQPAQHVLTLACEHAAARRPPFSSPPPPKPLCACRHGERGRHADGTAGRVYRGRRRCAGQAAAVRARAAGGCGGAVALPHQLRDSARMPKTPSSYSSHPPPPCRDPKHRHTCRRQEVATLWQHVWRHELRALRTGSGGASGGGSQEDDAGSVGGEGAGAAAVAAGDAPFQQRRRRSSDKVGSSESASAAACDMERPACDEPCGALAAATAAAPRRRAEPAAARAAAPAVGGDVSGVEGPHRSISHSRFRSEAAGQSQPACAAAAGAPPQLPPTATAARGDSLNATTCTASSSRQGAEARAATVQPCTLPCGGSGGTSGSAVMPPHPRAAATTPPPQQQATSSAGGAAHSSQEAAASAALPLALRELAALGQLRQQQREGREQEQEQQQRCMPRGAAWRPWPQQCQSQPQRVSPAPSLSGSPSESTLLQGTGGACAPGIARRGGSAFSTFSGAKRRAAALLQPQLPPQWQLCGPQDWGGREHGAAPSSSGAPASAATCFTAQGGAFNACAEYLGVVHSEQRGSFASAATAAALQAQPCHSSGSVVPSSSAALAAAAAQLLAERAVLGRGLVAAQAPLLPLGLLYPSLQHLAAPAPQLLPGVCMLPAATAALPLGALSCGNFAPVLPPCGHLQPMVKPVSLTPLLQPATRKSWCATRSAALARYRAKRASRTYDKKVGRGPCLGGGGTGSCRLSCLAWRHAMAPSEGGALTTPATRTLGAGAL